MLRKLVWGDDRAVPPRPGRDNPPRKDGDLPRPLMLVEDLEGEDREVGLAEGLVLVPLFGGAPFL